MELQKNYEIDVGENNDAVITTDGNLFYKSKLEIYDDKSLLILGSYYISRHNIEFKFSLNKYLNY